MSRPRGVDGSRGDSDPCGRRVPRRLVRDGTDRHRGRAIARAVAVDVQRSLRTARQLPRGGETGRSLVLLDEVAAGTDPDEGAALASAVLEALVTSGAAIAVTTHYERLKQLAAHDARFQNASVGFDFDTMSPTFRVTLGVPGASSALAVAARYGIPKDVIARAEALIPEDKLRRETLLAEIEADRARAATGATRARRRPLSNRNGFASRSTTRSGARGSRNARGSLARATSSPPRCATRAPRSATLRSASRRAMSGAPSSVSSKKS